MKQNVIRMTQLKNEDRMLLLALDNLVLERHLTRISLKEALETFPGNEVEEFLMQMVMMGTEVEVDLMCIKSKMQKRLEAELDKYFVEKTIEIREARLELAKELDALKTEIFLQNLWGKHTGVR
ncbi:hypothetical protein [Paenibacillus polymyxa]|uniref:Uncharacterized protein n=1 Tax=Paenibacillus polymyxa (strain SC2) TaxID=886882 RepID=E3EK81_PAEPS|nr:hypothetical protein [Paenibacillus polymyxa]ADO59408.1 hypothetical protein PPSC2_28015 [Paenibacillus polymyxa SC2]WPQ59751.1 hypothetical protein SKN87_26035 [Paenibacillus polymyxa]